MATERVKVVVVGGTIAGMMAALKATEHGASVLLASELPARRSSDAALQDGIACVMYPQPDGDSIDAHIRDTVYCGDFLADQQSVRQMCEQAPALVRMCDRMGVLFNRTPEGRIAQVAGGGSEHRRIAYADAAIGQQVVNALDGQVRRLESRGSIERREGAAFMSLVEDEKGVCRGAVFMDVATQELFVQPADAVVLCTGGYSSLYGITTSSAGDTGAEIAQAYLQGACLANPEFIQFHPTALPGADMMRPLGDLARAFGGTLWVRYNERNWRFMEEWFPHYAENVPDDVAARAVWKVIHELKLGAGGEPVVNLDLTAGDLDVLGRECPRLVDLCRIYGGVDPLREPVKVTVAAHRSLGGLWVDGGHMTTVPGLFAAGACDYRYHGAGCIGSNVVLASLHGGWVAGGSAAAYAAGLAEHSSSVPASAFERERDRQGEETKRFIERAEGENPRTIAREMGRLMDTHVGVERDDAGLAEADRTLEELASRFEKACPVDRSGSANAEIVFMRNLSRQLVLARVVVQAAWGRQESRGSHVRTDYPKRDDEAWCVTTKVRQAVGRVSFDYRERVDVHQVSPTTRAYA